MTDDTYLINGTDLTTLATRLETAEGHQEAPEWREADLEIPAMHGELDVGSDPTAQRRSFGPGRITFKGWVKGVDPVTGAWTGDGLDEYFARVDELMRLFYARSLQVDHPRTDGTRRAFARLAGSLAPAREPGHPWFGRWSAQLKIPAVFWSGTSDLTAGTAPGGVTSGGIVSLTPFAVASAPIADGVVTFGPGSNPTFIQGGTYVAYDAVIAAGRQLTIDCSDWSLGVGTGTAWTPDESKIRYGPGPAWFELDPTASLQAALTHTGGGAMFASFTGRPKFLTS